MFLVLLLYALFASVFTIAKTGLEFTQPFFFIGSRMTVAGLIMLGYQYFANPSELKFTKKSFLKLFLLATFNIYLTNAFEFWGLQFLTSFKTCFIYSLSPFVAALISYFVFSEKMSRNKWLGLLIGFLGFIPMLMTQTATEEGTGKFLMLSWAEIAVMMAAVCSVYGWILLRQLVKDEGCSPFTANGMSMLIGGAMALTHSSLVETWNPIPVTQFFPFFECAVLLIIISNFMAYNLYGFLLKRFTATFMSFAGFTTPLFTAFFGYIFLGETVTWPFYLSMAIVFFGLFAFYQEELKAGMYVPAESEKKVSLQ